MSGEREQVLFQFRQRHPLADGNAVVDDVQIRLLEIYDPLASGVFHIGIADIPFFWHTPIKHQRAGGNFSQLKGNLPLEQPEALPEAIAGDAAADGIELGDQAVHRLALSQGV
jgi:hypothetical protein